MNLHAPKHSVNSYSSRELYTINGSVMKVKELFVKCVVGGRFGVKDFGHNGCPIHTCGTQSRCPAVSALPPPKNKKWCVWYIIEVGGRK